MIQLTKSLPAPISPNDPKCKATIEKIENNFKDPSKGISPNHVDSSYFESSVYGPKVVRKRLREDQHERCAYCEISLLERDMHVDHFRPKTRYYKLAFVWENFIGTCSNCNRKKNDMFPLVNDSDRGDLAKEEPLLVNPYTENPADYFEFYQERIKVKDGLSDAKRKKAEKTIECLDLNRAGLCSLRKEWYSRWQAAQELLNNPEFSVQGDEIPKKFKYLYEYLVSPFNNDNHPFHLMIQCAQKQQTQ